MYGQGSYAPQFRQGPPAPPPPFPQAPHGLQPPFRQAPPGPPPPPIQQTAPRLPPPVYHHRPPPAPPQQPLHLPPPPQVSMGQPYRHPPPSVYRSAPVVPSYPHLGPSYSQQMPSQNAHHAPQPMPPLPPRMLPPPPPPPSQGQVLYRNPPPPPPGIQHVPTPPPPAPSSYVSITPAPFASFAHAPAEDAQPPSLPPPPPPPPPSSPPPLPLSPPPPTSQAGEFLGIVPKEPPTLSMDNTDSPVTPVAPAHLTDNMPTSPSEVGNFEKKIPLVVGEELGELPSPPLKPVEEVVQNIEVLCQFIAKTGPNFENLARVKEAGNPQFAFLFGGEPGTAAAIGHEYFQWMKRKYQFDMMSKKVLEQNTPLLRQSEMECSSQSGDLEDVGAAVSPAESDMDMEDDVSPSGNKRFDELNKDSTGEPISASSGIDVVKEPFYESQGATEHLKPEVPISSTISHSTSLPFMQDEEDDKDSPFIEDVSPVRASPGTAENALEDNAQGSVRTSTGDYGLVKVSLAVSHGKVEEIPRVFVEDRRPFRLIQDYASDDSEENDNRVNAEEISPVRVSPPESSDLHQDKEFELYSNFRPENASSAETGSEPPSDSSQPLTSTVRREVEIFTGSSPHKVISLNVICPSSVDLLKEAVDINIHQQDEKPDDTPQTFELPQEKETVEGDSTVVDQKGGKFDPEEDVKQDSTKPDVDEFGRLVRKGASDSDSDGMRANERRGKKGRSWSHSRSPQESRWRRRSRSPRRREKLSRSPSWSPRSKSPSSFRRTNVFARRERDQPPECFNFIRGRCFRGASCRYLHRDSGRQRSRQQQFQEYPQDSGDYSVHDEGNNVPVSENRHRDKIVVTEMDVDEGNNVLWEEQTSLDIQGHKELSEVTTKTSEAGVLDEKDALGSGTEDAQPAINEEVCELQVTEQVSQDLVSQMDEPEQGEGLVETSDIKHLEVEKSFKSLPESFEPLRADSLPIQPSPTSQTQPLLNETPDGQVDSGEGTSSQPSQPTPLPVETIQSTTFQNQASEAQPYLTHAAGICTDPIQHPVSQSYSNYAPTNQPSDQPLAPKEFPPPNLSVSGNLQPSPWAPSASQGHPPHHFPSENTSVPFASQHSRENLLPPVISHQPQLPPSQMFPSHGPPILPPVTSHQTPFPPSQMFPSHGPPIAIDYHPQRVPPPNPAWSNLPPPAPSHVNVLPNRSSFPSVEPPFLPFQQHAMPPRSDFNPQPSMRPTPPGELTRPQVVDFHPQPFHSAEPSHQPPPYIDRFRQMPFTMGNQKDQPFGRENQFPRPTIPGPHTISDSQRDYHLHHQSFLREEVRTPLPGQVFNSSGPFPQGGIMHPQSLPYPRDSLPNNPQSVPGDHLHTRFPSSGEFPPIRDLPHQPPYGHQRHSSNRFPSNLSTPGMVDTSVTRHPSSFLENNLPHHLPDTGMPKMPISTHYNPYASTFEQTPADLKFGSNVHGRENDVNYGNRYYPSVNSGHVLVDGPGSRITASPPNYRRSGEQMLERAGFYPRQTPAEVLPDVRKQFETEPAAGDAYDPLFDSIEPSSNAFKELDQVKESQGIHDGGTMSKLSNLHGPADVENTRPKEGVASELKSEADEFGEMATDAEVGAVENESPQPVGEKDWSPGIPIDVGNTAPGEIEIDQIRSPGKSKKSKDSRSMKLFRIALADFVKEVLKPSWRQGNMSKEAFKTIVKKTVDKVSGAMPSNQIPKTQVKINQYVESSQRKLTKLVMGYVDKYVKM